jgi:hypothetical protein
MARVVAAAAALATTVGATGYPSAGLLQKTQTVINSAGLSDSVAAQAGPQVTTTGFHTAVLFLAAFVVMICF